MSSPPKPTTSLSTTPPKSTTSLSTTPAQGVTGTPKTSLFTIMCTLKFIAKPVTAIVGPRKKAKNIDSKEVDPKEDSGPREEIDEWEEIDTYEIRADMRRAKAQFNLQREIAEYDFLEDADEIRAIFCTSRPPSPQGSVCDSDDGEGEIVVVV